MKKNVGGSGPGLVRMLELLAAAWVLGQLLCWMSMAVVADEDGETSSMHDLRRWLLEHGAYIHRCLEATTCEPYGGRCMKAVCDLKPDELLISVPASLQIVSYPDLEKTPYSQLASLLKKAKHMNFNNESTSLLVRLLDEKKRGRASPFWEYIQTLPKQYPAMLVEEDLQRRCLSKTPADGHHIARRFERLEALQSVLSSARVPCSRSEFRWAKQTLDTRAFSGTQRTKEWSIFVPFANIFNDALAPNAVWERADSGDFRVSTSTSIAASSEVSISYGPKTNEKLITSYGFVHANNPRDKIAFTLAESGPAGMPPTIALPLNPFSQAELLQVVVHVRKSHQSGSGSLEYLHDQCWRLVDEWKWTDDIGEEGWMCKSYRDELVTAALACEKFVAAARGVPSRSSDWENRLADRLAAALIEIFEKLEKT